MLLGGVESRGSDGSGPWHDRDHVRIMSSRLRLRSEVEVEAFEPGGRPTFRSLGVQQNKTSSLSLGFKGEVDHDRKRDATVLRPD